VNRDKSRSRIAAALAGTGAKKAIDPGAKTPGKNAGEQIRKKR
jgi:hypothetical protein